MTHPIPPEALAHHLAFLGKTGSGKSNAAKVIVEESLDAGERVCVLDPTGAWWVLARVYPAGMTSGQLAARVGIKKKGSTFSAYKSRLRTAGLIEERGGLIFASKAGAAAIGDVEPLPDPGPALARSWAAKLHGTAPVVEYLLERHPAWVDRAQLAADLGINPQGSTISAYISRLFTAGVVAKDGPMIRLTDEVMG